MPINISRKSNSNGINYTYEADGPADHVLIANDTYFRDKTDSLIYYKNASGTVLSLFNELDTPTTDALVHVMPSGSDATGQRADISKPFLTLEAASTAAIAGDTIIVYPGTYTPAANIHKNGVNWYFHKGAIINTAGILFSVSGTGGNVMGYADFVVTAGGDPVYIKNHASDKLFQCDSVTGGRAVQSNLADSVYTMTVDVRNRISSGNNYSIYSAVATNWHITCPIIENNAIGLYTIEAQSCTTYNINATTILNAAGLLSINTFGATGGTINATRTNTISCAYGLVNVKYVQGTLSLNSDSTFNGYATTYSGNGGRHEGGMYESINMTSGGYSGSLQRATLIDGTAGSTFNITSPNKQYLDVICPVTGLGYRTTVRTMTLSGADSVVRLLGDWDTTNYTWNISAGTLIIDGRYRIGAGASTTFNLSGTGKIIINGSIESLATSAIISVSSVNASIISKGGSLICSDSYGTSAPIVPSIPGIGIKVLSGGLTTNYLAHNIYTARNITRAYLVTATTASMTLNDGTNGAQAVTSSAPAASITAARDEIVADINSGLNSALINMTAIPYNKSSDRFIVVADSPLDTITSGAIVGMIEGGFQLVVGNALTDLTGGLLLADLDAE